MEQNPRAWMRLTKARTEEGKHTSADGGNSAIYTMEGQETMGNRRRTGESGREAKSQEHEAQDGGDSKCLPAYGGGNRANKATAFRVVHEMR